MEKCLNRRVCVCARGKDQGSGAGAAKADGSMRGGVKIHHEQRSRQKFA